MTCFVAVMDAEERRDGHFDVRLLIAVEVDAQRQVQSVDGLGANTPDGEPHVTEAAFTFHFGHDGFIGPADILSERRSMALEPGGQPEDSERAGPFLGKVRSSGRFIYCNNKQHSRNDNHRRKNVFLHRYSYPKVEHLIFTDTGQSPQLAASIS
jgi:hypothetical protein